MSSSQAKSFIDSSISDRLNYYYLNGKDVDGIVEGDFNLSGYGINDGCLDEIVNEWFVNKTYLKKLKLLSKLLLLLDFNKVFYFFCFGFQ